MKVTSLAVQGMWSFDASGVDLRELSDNTILIGKNNSGKSNLLKAITSFLRHREWLNPGSTWEVPTSEFFHQPDGTVVERAHLALGLAPNDHEALQISEAALANAPGDGGRHTPYLAGLLTQEVVVQVDTSWDQQQRRSNAILAGGKSLVDLPVPAGKALPEEIVKYWRGGGFSSLLVALKQLMEEKITFVSGWRSLAQDSNKAITDLRTMQAPPANQPELMRHFGMVEDFFRDITGLKHARIRVEPHEDRINVQEGSRYLPLDSFGDGIQHFLMLAYYFATRRDHVFLVEEPETHVHPGLQRHLLAYIRSLETNNQYFLTTHSSVLLDSLREASVFRVKYDGESSAVDRCETSSDVLEVLDLLDIRASDLLQANLVVWVEGPTDRMFIKRCLELLRPDLSEGMHYQVVCYGGRLLSYLTTDEEASDWVNVLRLARNAVIMCDSDKASENDEISDTKQRLRHECDDVGAMFWLTGGREIENYIPDHVLNATYKELMGEPDVRVALGRYDKLGEVLASRWPDPPKGSRWKVAYGESKSRIMPLFLERMTEDDLKRYDLQQQLTGLLKRIDDANPEHLSGAR